MKKKMIVILSIVMLVGILLVMVSNQGSEGKVSSSVKNSFSEVTSQLNENGNIYLYVSTERMIKALDDIVLKFKTMAEKEMAANPDESKEAFKIMDFVYGIIKKSGLLEISGIGFSSVAIEKDLNHSKLVVHHYSDKGKGIIWQLSENKPHKLDMLNLLPANTAAAGYGDFKFGPFWNWLKQKFNAADIPAAKQGFTIAENAIQLMGIDLDKIKSNLSNGMGFVLTLNKGKMCQFPVHGSVLEVPDPGIAVIVYVKDDYLFKLFQSKITIAKQSVEKSIKKLRIPLPIEGAPITLDPVIAQKDNLLVFASSAKLVDAMFAAQEKGNDLTTTIEFKRFSKEIPVEGNSFRYLGTEFFDVILGLIKNSIKNAGGARPDSEEASKFFPGMFSEKLGGYGVMHNTSEGFVFTFNHTFNLEQLVLLPATIIPGIVTAIAVPNFLTALQKGKLKSTMGDMKTIGMSIESYLVDNNYAPIGNTLSEIQSLLMPFYIKILPLKDAWGNDFLYKHGTGKGKDVYFIASAGKDGIFDGWEQTGFYPYSAMADFNNDIIFSNGSFIFGPKVR